MFRTREIRESFRSGYIRSRTENLGNSALFSTTGDVHRFRRIPVLRSGNRARETPRRIRFFVFYLGSGKSTINVASLYFSVFPQVSSSKFDVSATITISGDWYSRLIYVTTYIHTSKKCLKRVYSSSSLSFKWEFYRKHVLKYLLQFKYQHLPVKKLFF